MKEILDVIGEALLIATFQANRTRHNLPHVEQHLLDARAPNRSNDPRRGPSFS